jgi:hypothetical protein
MKKLTVRLAALAGAVLLVALPVTLAEDGTTEPEVLAPVEPVDVMEVKEKPDIIISGCLPSSRLTCDSMPIPYGGSCSCTSTLLPVKCVTCDDGEKGQVVKTTCTVRNPCWNPPCDLQANYTRTAYSCSP